MAQLGILYKNATNDGFSVKSLNNNYMIEFKKWNDKDYEKWNDEDYENIIPISCNIYGENLLYILTNNETYFVDTENCEYLIFEKVEKVLYSYFGFVGKLQNKNNKFRYYIETGTPNKDKFIISLDFELTFGCVYYQDQFIVGNNEYILSTCHDNLGDNMTIENNNKFSRNYYAPSFYKNSKQIEIYECISDNEENINNIIDNILTRDNFVKNYDANTDIDIDMIDYIDNYQQQQNLIPIPIVIEYYQGKYDNNTLYHDTINIRDIKNILILFLIDNDFDIEIRSVKYYNNNKWNNLDFDYQEIYNFAKKIK